MINCVIAAHVLTEAQLPPPTTNAPSRRRGYAFAVHLLQHNELPSAVNASDHFIGAVIDDDTGAVLEYRHLIKLEKYSRIWERSFANELGRLFQGIRDIPDTDTCFYIRKSKVPKHKRATYGCIVCNVRPQKEEIYRTQLTVGGNLINFPGNKFSPPNPSSTPPSVPREPCSSALTWPTSTSTLRWPIQNTCASN
jgi:hypothetical protein